MCSQHLVGASRGNLASHSPVKETSEQRRQNKQIVNTQKKEKKQQEKAKKEAKQAEEKARKIVQTHYETAQPAQTYRSFHDFF